MTEKFRQKASQWFVSRGGSIEIGHARHEGELYPDVPVSIPLAMMNRHGLIAGSTGTGKTRTLQTIVEQLSRNGVPTFVSDVKGDVTGLARPGESSQRLIDRMASVGRSYEPEAFPVELFSLTGTNGTQLRASVSTFGPLLLGKVLDLTAVQQSVLTMVFRYCDDRQMPLLDFKDLRGVLVYLGNEGKEELRDYGGMSPQTVGVLIRKMIELEQQGAEKFFGEPELAIEDLIRLDPAGRGIVNILSLADVQDKPRLISTFLMWLLGRFYYTLPEVGDLEKPKLVFFFDEAHLLFKDSSKALIEQIEQVARLIRSKGIGVFFITQTTRDVSAPVLSQLGNRIQHAVRAFTPEDARNLRATASTFPKSEFYQVDRVLTSLGIGEALVSVLDSKGVPTPVTVAQILAPASFMGPLTPEEYAEADRRSQVAFKYRTAVDRDSAHEMLQRILQQAAIDQQKAEVEASRRVPPPRTSGGRAATSRAPRRQQRSVFSSPVAKTAARQAARTLTQQVMRGLLGLLKR
jgi:uncharacterized protein